MARQLFLLTLAKHALLSINLAASLLALSWWLVSSEPMKDPRYFDRLQESSPSRFFRVDGEYGLVILYQTMPVVVMTLLSFAVIELRKKIKSLQHCMNVGNNTKAKQYAKAGRSPRPNVSTYPLIVHTGWWNPFGVLTAAEALILVGMLFVVFYSFGRLTRFEFNEVERKYNADPQLSLHIPMNVSKLKRATQNLGRASLLPFALLWIPVSRGSPLLRLLKLPFEHAVKYHIWLATLTLTLLSGHSVCCIIYYYQINSPSKILNWVTEREKSSFVAGVVAWIIGLLMWGTSLPYVRRRWYEVFFGVHQLYIVFFLFWLYHALWTIHFFIVPALLFVVDRLLRMVQSRHPVDVLSATMLESGAVKLHMAITNLQSTRGYHALSSWYLRFPSLSRLMKLQWHFFSVTSTPLDEKHELSFVIKPLGKWTKSLQSQILQSSKANATTGGRCPFSFKAGIEGPYGDETDFYLRYNTLVLVGGGIGITPLLAVLCDILHRQRRSKLEVGKKSIVVPSTILVYHCVRKAEELSVLNSMDPKEISPGYEKRGLRIRVSVFVTSASSIDHYNIVDDEEVGMQVINPYPQAACNDVKQRTLDLTTATRIKAANCTLPVTIYPCKTTAASNIKGVSSVGSKGASAWVAATMLASITGFYLLWGLSNLFIVKHLHRDFPTNFDRAHLLLASIILATLLFGGPLVLIWWCLSSSSKSAPAPSTSLTMLQQEIRVADDNANRPSSASSYNDNIQQEQLQPNNMQDTLHSQVNEVGDNNNIVLFNRDEENNIEPTASPWKGTLHLGVRPAWREIFDGLTKEYHGQNIGVLVSGSENMQADVAKECQRHTPLFDTSLSSNVFHYHSVSFEL
ncbi:hypothetical protein GOP47_0004067 [Adiantum capillus-veneris]|uniref:FAD-binding FR-type domain-containing protein n=1 Tax=Adiantum capillus-veneris TaxID=13818 RepID=A0A9D4V7D3_ADICA|nr:hypothetical protein GOP47_0004067 [Adiantum capillus-veneris]